MKKKQHLSTFSGVGGFDIVMEETGEIETVAFVEKDPYCREVLATHWPDKPIFHDIKEVSVEEIKAQFGTIDIITGGFPCQDLSVAGNRKGFAGERSSLWFEFLRLTKGLQPEWIIVENVPGLLSSNRGRDFAVLLRGLVECGYGVAYRILDAKWFGIPQRRRRVFIVGHLGDGRAAEVLFEREGVSWDTPPRTSQRQEVAGTLKGGSGERGWSDPSDGNGGGLTTDRPAFTDPDTFVGWDLDGRPLTQRDIDERERLTGPFWDGTDQSPTLDVSSLVKGQMMPEKNRFPVVIQHSTIGRKDEAGAQGSGVRDDGTTWTLDGRGDADVVAFEQAEVETYKQNLKGDFSEENADKASTLSAYRSSQHRQVAVIYKEHGGNGASEEQEVAGPLTEGAGEKQAGRNLIVITNDSRGQMAEDGKALPLTKSDTGTGRQMVAVYENHAQDSRITESEEVSPTLHSKMGTGGNNVPLVEAVDVRNLESADVAQTVQAKKSGGYSLNYSPVVFQADGSGMEVTEDGTTPTVLHGGDGPQAHGAYRKLAAVVKSTIRRFTPLETELLQGFPPGWTAVFGKKKRAMFQDDFDYMKAQLERMLGREVTDGEVVRAAADSHRYRQMGNGVALPPVRWIVGRLLEVWNSPAPELLKVDDVIKDLGQGEQLRLI